MLILINNSEFTVLLSFCIFLIVFLLKIPCKHFPNNASTRVFKKVKVLGQLGHRSVTNTHRETNRQTDDHEHTTAVMISRNMTKVSTKRYIIDLKKQIIFNIIKRNVIYEDLFIFNIYLFERL